MTISIMKEKNYYKFKPIAIWLYKEKVVLSLFIPW